MSKLYKEGPLKRTSFLCLLKEIPHFKKGQDKNKEKGKEKSKDKDKKREKGKEKEKGRV